MKKNTYILWICLSIVLLVVFLAYGRVSKTRVIKDYNRDINVINVEDEDSEIQKNLEDVAIVHNIVPNQIISSPLSIDGKARGVWFFEASFPIKLLDSNYKEIASAIATAKSDWMTTDFVNFEAVLTFVKPNLNSGFIVFQKDNPSGLKENDQKIYVPIKF